MVTDYAIAMFLHVPFSDAITPYPCDFFSVEIL